MRGGADRKSRGSSKERGRNAKVSKGEAAPSAELAGRNSSWSPNDEQSEERERRRWLYGAAPRCWARRQS